ncbi:MAG TPA: thioredoxin domain-containing protein [Gallionellaceae bacterium]|nr:thioredoxin domain-containing protein [Gallionellaceae bacterium]
MPNHLISETSPYLQQHADNPVDWYPWNAESLRLAREQDKPILLSIGYSACHWCHVMAHESFEDAGIAALMNAHFINIKVDREERPDLDQIYQTAHYMLTQRSGGWPLTMFLTPDGTPFFGGTYFPKWNSHNLPAFPDVLRHISTVYREHRDELAAQNRELLAVLARSAGQLGQPAEALHDAPLEAASNQLAETFDHEHGGFGDAPKFPHPVELDFLLRHSRLTGDAHAEHMVLHTLEQMAHGGIYDQLGGGFCRYSVDAYWNIPHFEKMLYDNGLLLALYCDAWQQSGNPLFAHVVEETAGWVQREMTTANGGFCSSLDADSEHEEGKFYVWQRDDILDLLTPEEFAVVAPHFGLDLAPNFEQLAWHLHVSVPLSRVAVSHHLNPDSAGELLASARSKLFAAREQRVRPGRDDKVLSSWNGLMITGMARAARVMQRRDWLHTAQRAMDFLRTTMWREGRLLAAYRSGKAHLNAYLDDYAVLLQAALELMQAEFRTVDLEFAIQLADALLAGFEDKDDGGFFFTSHDHEALIQRPRSGQDNAIPSGNGIAAAALQRLAVITGKQEYGYAAERCLKAFFPAMQQGAGYHCSLCTALGEYLQPASLLVLRGKPAEMAAWRMDLRRRYLPNVITMTLPDNAGTLPEPLAKPVTSQPTAWLCRGTQCLPPITRIGDLLSALNSA